MTSRFMPPEWAPHDATWMGFPRDSYAETGLTRECAQRAWSRVANAISEHEPVNMLCHPDDLARAKRNLSAAVSLLPVPLNDAWLRDIGPTFMIEDHTLTAIDWPFNGWGQNTELDWALDDGIARRVADFVETPMMRATIVNEGGGLHVNGAGYVLLTDTVQLDPQRNPGLTREVVAAHIHALLGTTDAIWLPRGLWRDNFLNGTKGHVDLVACFTPDGRVLVHHQNDDAHPDHALWKDIEPLLTDRGFEIIPLPAPSTLKDNRDWVDYSYINHYVCNGAVLCPSFSDKGDDRAEETLRDAYDGREIISIESRELFAMGGGIHCITQQQPSPLPRTDL
jgi:agmatine deiminase